jgi:glycosyltransferase involved in cell wall biosynthesis
VVLVGNPAAPYSRALRLARVLTSEGFETEIAAVSVDRLPEREQDGDVVLRRYTPSGPLAVFAAAFSGYGPEGQRPRQEAPGLPAAAWRRATRRVRRFVGRQRARFGVVVRWLLWPHTVRGWWAALDRDLRPADLYHACGSLTIAPALHGRRSAERKATRGDRPVVVYDAVDNVFESNNVLAMPSVIRRWHERREAGWARDADARMAVNEALAERLAARWKTDRPLVLPNYPEPWTPPSTRPDLIRRELGLGPTTRIVLFQGRLSPYLGLDEAAAAILHVRSAALVLIGFGRWLDRCRARDHDPRYAGRHFTLGPRHPDELLAWTASADVALVPLPPVSMNQRMATPNKFWEALAVGTPVVVGPDLPVMNRLVEELDLGVVAASLEPRALADAIQVVIDRPGPDVEAWRARIADIARQRFSWPRAAESYRALVRDLTGTGPIAQ